MTTTKAPSRLISYLTLGIVLLLVLYARVRLLSLPLERDEGEYAYIGQLLLKGIPPFTHAYSMKLPGVSFLYALFMTLFGQTAAAIHVGLLVVNLACTLLVFLLGKRLLGEHEAAVAAASYALLSLSEAVYGAHAHATQFVVFFALAGFFLMFRALDRSALPSIAASGLCFGAAFTMKQHAAIIAAFALLYFIRRNWGVAEQRRFLFRSLPLFFMGLVAPYLLIVVAMAKAGSLESFRFWTLDYPRAYVSEMTIWWGVRNFFRSFAGDIWLQLPFWLLAAAGGVLAAKGRSCRDPWFLLGLAVSSFLAMCPGLYFREHYFVLLLPAVALLAGAGAAGAAQLLPLTASSFTRSFPAALLVIAAAYSCFMENEYLFRLEPLQVSRMVYGPNPFPESVKVAQYLREHTAAGDRIAVLGSEPQIYFYADRISATGHIYMYGLMEDQPFAGRMQQQMIQEIEGAKPGYVVKVEVDKSWLMKSSSDRSVVAWSDRYLQQGYEKVGVVDIISSVETKYVWDREAAGYTPKSHAYLLIFKRKTGV